MQVSIHAPRAGRDCGSCRCAIVASRFNPRAPCGARRFISAAFTYIVLFQSTRPVRGATIARFHIPRVNEFQSTRPVRGATIRLIPLLRRERVSIHAPRAGRDASAPCACRALRCFNPRAPCGARLLYGSQSSDLKSFNPRAPCGARQFPLSEGSRGGVSIHAPRAGRDFHLCDNTDFPISFNPRAPCGARHVGSSVGHQSFGFQSTRPVRGATTPGSIGAYSKAVSIHAPRAGRDTLFNL